MQAERPGIAGFLFGVLCAAMFGLAAGAIWMLPAMMFGRALPALALPVGWALGVVVRRWLRFSGAAGALLAAGATLLAALYTTCLVAAATISGMMGIGFGQAIVDAGPGMLLALGRLAQGPGQLACYLVGAVLAALSAWPVKRRIERRGRVS
jgi:vitamin B12 transport system permease protein